MFNKKYKNAMDKITPNEDALKRAINGATIKPRSLNGAKIVLIACLSVALICSSIFAAFKLNQEQNPTIGHIINNTNQNESTTTDISEGSTNEKENIDAALSQQGFSYAKSYEEIYQALKESKEYLYIIGTDSDDLIVDGEIEVEEDALPEAPSEENTTPEFSNTNNQVLGVQEGDIVKTDGHYIYHLSKSQYKVYIVSAKDGITNIVSEITLPSVSYRISVSDLLLIQNTLAIIGETYYYPTETVCLYYDITDKSKPVKSDETIQSGCFNNCRAINDVIYIISKQIPYFNFDDNNIDYAEFIPEVNEEPIDYNNVLITDTPSSTFTVITAYNTTKKERISSLAALNRANTIYCSKNNIYLVSTTYAYNLDERENGFYESSDNTEILRISLNNGNISANGMVCINGTVLNQFSLDEKDGNLRVATTLYPVTYADNRDYSSVTQNSSYSKVYCLNSEMKVIGESEPLGITEQIKSVRYIGNIAYVVTFRQTDPLYAIDLTDPTEPKTLSELKIDGFSTYMQNYGSDYMLGIGYEATPEGMRNGVKLTMFDISDPADIYDVSTASFLYGEENSAYFYSEALNNHKAVLLDYKKGIIGIPFISEKLTNTDEWYYEYKTILEYKLFNFNGEELSVDKSFTLPVSQYCYDIRALYIGDYLYVVLDDSIISVNLNDYSIVNTISY